MARVLGLGFVFFFGLVFLGGDCFGVHQGGWSGIYCSWCQGNTNKKTLVKCLFLLYGMLLEKHWCSLKVQ